MSRIASVAEFATVEQPKGDVKKSNSNYSSDDLIGSRLNMLRT